MPGGLGELGFIPRLIPVWGQVAILASLTLKLGTGGAITSSQTGSQAEDNQATLPQPYEQAASCLQEPSSVVPGLHSISWFIVLPSLTCILVRSHKPALWAKRYMTGSTA